MQADEHVTTPIAHVFARCRDAGRAALIPYVTGGHPTLADTIHALPAIADAGADLIEIGLPFSDPIADGPVIAEAMHEALVAGVTPAAVLDAAGGLAERVAVPMLAMVSCSIVHRIGAEAFVRSLAAAQIRGVIVPDIDFDAEFGDGFRDGFGDGFSDGGDPSAPGRSASAGSLGARCADAGIDLILLAAPTTAPKRLERIAAAARGFIYVIARTGITGARGNADLDELARRIDALRGMTDTPLAVGFGISNAEDVARIAAIADGVIVGTAIVQTMGRASAGQAAPAVAELVRNLAAATEKGIGRRA